MGMDIDDFEQKVQELVGYGEQMGINMQDLVDRLDCVKAGLEMRIAEESA